MMLLDRLTYVYLWNALRSIMEDSVPAFFDRLAERWDERASNPRERVDHVLDILWGISGKSVLDVDGAIQGRSCCCLFLLSPFQGSCGIFEDCSQ